MSRNAFKSQSKILQARISEVTGRFAGLEIKPALVAPRQALHPVARLRQSKGRWYTTHAINAAVRRFISTSAPKYDCSSFPKSATRSAVESLTGRAPFASTLRPNLTGGAFPRTAGGYSLGGGRIGGARHFSHTPAAPAQVVQNVSNAFRAFALSGQKVQYDGMTCRNEKKYRTVSNLQKATMAKLQSIPKVTPGSYIDFSVNPTITALGPLGKRFSAHAVNVESQLSINTEGFLDILSVDFARALKDLAAITNDLKRLSTLGDLSITMENKSTLRVHFPGCDAETVENICDELGIQRGIVHQDFDFDTSVGGDIALKFPFAPTSEHTLSSPGGSVRSQTGHDFDDCNDEYNEKMDSFGDSFENPWLSPEPLLPVDELSESGSEYFGSGFQAPNSSDPNTSEYLNGINRFLEFCETTKI